MVTNSKQKLPVRKHTINRKRNTNGHCPVIRRETTMSNTYKATNILKLLEKVQFFSKF